MYENSPYVAQRVTTRGQGLTPDERANLIGQINEANNTNYMPASFDNPTPQGPSIEELREAERARVAALGGDSSYRPNYYLFGGRVRAFND